MTNLRNVTVKLEQVRGTQYVFQSGSTFYFWNSATEEGAKVTDPTDYAKLCDQMDKNIDKVRVEMLPDLGD